MSSYYLTLCNGRGCLHKWYTVHFPKNKSQIRKEMNKMKLIVPGHSVRERDNTVSHRHQPRLLVWGKQLRDVSQVFSEIEHLI